MGRVSELSVARPTVRGARISTGSPASVAAEAVLSMRLARSAFGVV